MSPMERLQKVLAMAGVASRRTSEDIIRQGRVQVNGRVIMEQGVKVDPAVDHVTVDGIPLPRAAPSVYILLHKPAGVLSTASDEFGRKTVLDLVPATERLYPVGRLDAESEGLILLTNDGELTARLTHPRYGHTREYRALVHGQPKEGELQKMRRGIVLDDGPSGPAEVEVLAPGHIRHEDLPLPDRDCAWLKIVIREGRKRQIRRMCEIIGHPVVRLIRIGMGPLSLGTLPAGKYRFLKPAEVKALQATLYDKPRTTSRPRRASGAAPRPHTAPRPTGQGDAARREERTGSRPQHGREDTARRPGRENTHRSKRPQR